MSYAQDSLRPGEKIVLETRLSLVPLILSIFWGVVLLWVPTLIIFLRYLKTEFVVTDKRLLVKKGIISVTADETTLDKVQNISLRQTILGRIFGYGTILIQTGATFGRDRISYVKNPKELRDTIGRQAEIYRTDQIKEQAEAIARGIAGAQRG